MDICAQDTGGEFERFLPCIENGESCNQSLKTDDWRDYDFSYERGACSQPNWRMLWKSRIQPKWWDEEYYQKYPRFHDCRGWCE